MKSVNETMLALQICAITNLNRDDIVLRVAIGASVSGRCFGAIGGQKRERKKHKRLNSLM